MAKYYSGKKRRAFLYIILSEFSTLLEASDNVIYSITIDGIVICIFITLKLC